MSETENGARASVVIFLNDQADLSQAYTIKNPDERGWYVYNALASHAERTQKSIASLFKERGLIFRSYWIANMLVTEADRSLVTELAARSDIARIDSNTATRWIETEQIANFGVDSSSLSAAPSTIEWGIANVNAPNVWNLGFKGSGIVVGDLDTGVRWTHQAIKAKYRGWNGVTANHNYNWHDAIHTGGGICGPNTTVPCDDNGHGSHTVGTMLGDDENGNQIGVAPGAKWIGCRNMNEGFGTPATYAECFQFMIAPTDSLGNNPNPTLRPHVLNNSWSCPPNEGCTTGAEIETIVANTQAAGIFVEVSAGNSGPNCSTVSTPAAIYSESFSTGAISITNTLASFSSRGPSLFYSPGILKPNISAPGVNVRSISGSSDDGYSNRSGTSMAGPHVSGVVALLWSAHPDLNRDIARTKTVLQNSANPDVAVAAQTCGGIPSTQIPNNSFGYGRVDALAAVNALGTPGPTPTPTPGGIESDIAGRNSGDGLLLANDLPLIRQFVVGTLVPDTVSNEFQRADSAPLAMLGNGVIDSADIVQARRYVVGLDPVQSAGGPASSTQTPSTAFVIGGLSNSVSTRAMRAGSVTAMPGSRVAIDVELDAQGDETALSFTLGFDSAKLADPQVTLGTGSPTGAILTNNTLEKGRVKILIDSASPFANGKVAVVTVSFDVAATAPNGETPITFSESSISDTVAHALPSGYTSGSVSISTPTASGVEVSGRVLTPDGRGLRNLQVEITGEDGFVRTANTSSFGLYRFEGMPTGKQYIVSVKSKRYRFAARVFDLNDNLFNVNLIAME
ncbi:MAG: S8 family serine peptidase [Pyrinomonadaceae bacterium]